MDGCMDQLPKELFTVENMSIRDGWGMTPIHKAIEFELFHRIPSWVVTVESMLVKDNEGLTPLHDAAIYGVLNCIPKSLLTTEYLLMENNEGTSALHFAAANSHLDQVPLGLKLPESVRELVGEDWWARNQAVLCDKELLSAEEEGVEVEIF